MNELSFFDSLFNNVLGNTPSVMYSNACTPRVDVKEENDSYSLEMELPGRSENDVNIELDHETLTIASKESEPEKKEDCKEKNGCRYILKERRSSNFERRFTLPNDVNFDSISANFKNGVLTIKMDKKPVEAPKKISIEAC